MSRRLIVPGYTFTGPRLKSDPIETDGSLLLVEPAHLAYPWDAGVPTSGSAVTNVVAATAEPYIGDSSPTYVNAGLTGSYGLVERSGGGGLHGIASVNALPAGKEAYVRVPDGVVQHMIDNPTHHYYMSAWERMTRNAAALAPRFVIAAGDQVKSQAFWYGSGARPSGANRVAANYTVWPLAAPAHQAITSGGWDGSVPAAPSEVYRAWRWGRTPTSAFYNEGTPPSHVLYRLYIEDLTISGRTHAEVYALEATLFDAAFDAGGRYYGDTYTDPTTIP